MSGVAHRLPLTMRTVFQDLLLITYEVPPELLAAQLPAFIHPYVHNAKSYVSIVIGNLRGMRPAVVPEFLGVNYYQVVYRAVVKINHADGRETPGVFFLRSDGNDPVMSFFGNRLTEFRFHYFQTGGINLYHRDNELLATVETADGRGDLLIHAIDHGSASAFPCAPGFATLDEEKRVLVELFHAYAHDPQQKVVYDLEIERGEWNVSRLELSDEFSAFFAEGPFDRRCAKPVSALYIQECDYIWKPMMAVAEHSLTARQQ